MTKKVLTIVLASAALLGVSLPAAAVIDSWNTNSGSNVSSIGSGDWGNVRSYSSDNGMNVSASAWSNTVGSGNSANAHIDNAYLPVYNIGLGAVNRDGISGSDSSSSTDNYESLGTPPEHAIDNNERFDSVLFSFQDAVKLTSVSLGYKPTDGDASILAYTGGAALPADLRSYFNGLSYADLISNGWTLIGNFANLALGSNSVLSASSVYSSYWLVGAYNSAFGSGSGLDVGNDYFKISALSAERQPPCNGGSCGGGSVPEPSSLMMAGLAIALAGSALQRRGQNRA